MSEYGSKGIGGPLFDARLDRPDPRASRSTDPPTSRAAELEHENRGGNQAKILEAIRQHPDHTGRELATRWLDLEAYEVSKRLSDLERKGAIVSRDTRRCRVSGRKARTWRELPA